MRYNLSLVLNIDDEEDVNFVKGTIDVCAKFQKTFLIVRLLINRQTCHSSWLSPKAIEMLQGQRI